MNLLKSTLTKFETTFLKGTDVSETIMMDEWLIISSFLG